ncbi:hypothetical protein [Oceanobacter mangrovi]|uniref:hypothetical protein n=1 Tax=Oceanobacter mangrovi TaxID=2862510 RepID=UPI001C8D7402
MSYPQFIAVDGSSYEEEANPIAIAWSLPDGRIKTTLVQPDDGWDDWDYALEDIHGITRDTLYQRGETSWAIVRELENDLEQSYILTDDEERSGDLIEKIYEACNREISIEVGDYSSDITDQDALQHATQQLFHEHLTCDERVLVMLQTWAHENGYPEEVPEPEENDDSDS